MSTRKLAGLFLIVMGLVRIFQSLSGQGQTGRAVGSLYVFMTVLLFTLGAALVWWDNKWLNGDSRTQD